MKSVQKAVKKIGLREVARSAGVSIATASRVLSGAGNVNQALHERVIKAAAGLGVDVERKHRSRIIAFLLSNRAVLHPFHSSVLVGAEAYCAAHDYGLLFLLLQYPPNVPWKNLLIPQILQQHEIIRAAIVAGTNSQNLLDFLAHKNIPFAVLGNNVLGDWKKEEHSAVYFDDIEGAYELTRYLQSLGHEKIWYVGNCRLPWFARRYEGYRRAMEQANLRVLLSDVNSDNGEDLGYLATKTIFSKGEPVTAIFAGEDSAARGAYRALRDRGIRIPEDISVAGFNDTSEASALSPPLTSTHVFTDQLGRQMAEMVMNRIARPDLPPQVLTLPTRLAKRESCCALFEARGATVAPSPIPSLDP